MKRIGFLALVSVAAALSAAAPAAADHGDQWIEDANANHYTEDGETVYESRSCGGGGDTSAVMRAKTTTTTTSSFDYSCSDYDATKCWRNRSSAGYGIWPYNKWLAQWVRWCARRGKITHHYTWHEHGDGPACWLLNGPYKSKYSGGVGYFSVGIKSEAEFLCEHGFFQVSLWVWLKRRYDSNGYWYKEGES